MQAVAAFPDLTVEGLFKHFIFYLDDGYVMQTQSWDWLSRRLAVEEGPDQL
jgi:hypothetical protein